MTEPLHAHFLHEKKGLSAVISPPIDRPRALCWTGRSDRLLVATDAGEVVEFDAVLGTRELNVTVRDPAEMLASKDGRRFVLIERAHGISLHQSSDGQRLAHLPVPMLSDISAVWFRRGPDSWGLAVAGDDLDGRKVVLASEDLSRHKVARVPARTAVGVNEAGALVYGRISSGGLAVAKFGDPLPQGPPTRHRLRFASAGLVMGMADGGVTLWQGADAAPRTIMVYDVSAAAVHPEGELVAVGTRTGEVAFSGSMNGVLERARPGKVGGHSTAVRAMAFAEGSRWLATAADDLRIWTW